MRYVLWVVAFAVAGLLASLGGWGIALAVLVFVIAAVVDFIVVAPAADTHRAATPEEARPPLRVARPTTAAATHRAQVAERKITRLGTQGWQQVAGEYYHQKAIATVVDGRSLSPAGQWDAGLRVLAYLVPEPGNRHDSNAVMVQLAAAGGTEHVGYLPADVAPRWRPVLTQLAANGRVGECRAHVFGTQSGTPMVVLRLSEPDEAILGNHEPDGAELLDAERQCAVVGEQHHQDVLSRYEPGPMWATLHPGVVPAGKYAGQATVEVRIDGELVGTLNAAQGERYGDLVTGEVVACEARIFDGSRHREVSLMLPKVD